MSAFEDAAGNSWNIEIDCEAIRRVRKQTGFAFGTCLNGDMATLYEMLDDYQLLAEVITALLEPQWKQNGLAQNTMLNNVKGDAIESAQQSLWEAFAFFCPPRTRTMLANMKKTMEKLTEDQMASTIEMLETYTSKQSSSRESSGLMQDLTASGN